MNGACEVFRTVLAGVLGVSGEEGLFQLVVEVSVNHAEEKCGEVSNMLTAAWGFLDKAVEIDESEIVAPSVVGGDEDMPDVEVRQRDVGVVEDSDKLC